LICDCIGRISRADSKQCDPCSYEADVILEALERYLRAGFFWFWICVGILLAFNSYDDYGSGLGALMFGCLFFVYALRRLYRKSKTSKVHFRDFALVIFAVVVTVSRHYNTPQTGQQRSELLGTEF
jgi:hypothetical protein